VQVEFHIVDRIYRNELGTQSAAAEKAFLPIFIEQLQRKIGFLQFSGERQSPSSYRLVIELGDSNRTALENSSFRIRLLQPDGAAIGPTVSWLFRSFQDSLRAFSNKQAAEDKVHDIALIGGAHAEPPGELRRKFAAADFDRIVSQLLSQISVASQAQLKEGPPDPRWELPFDRGDTCMELHSRFRIAHALVFSDETEDLPLEVEAVGPADGSANAMRAPISARIPASNPQTILVARLGNPRLKSVEIKGVYVLLYRGSELGCSPVVAPVDAGLVREGGQ